MLIRVARETRAYHAAADADRVALMDVVSTTDYAAFLARIYGFESAVELAVSRGAVLDPNVSGLRARVERLHDDLVGLGMSTDEVNALARCRSIHVRTQADAFAWLFIVERTALLSGLIRRYLASKLPDAIARASAYLDVYPDPGSRIRTFGEAMTIHVRRGVVQPDAIVVAARKAFESQHHWYGRVACLRARTTEPIVIPRTAPPPPMLPPPSAPIEPREIA